MRTKDNGFHNPDVRKSYVYPMHLTYYSVINKYILTLEHCKLFTCYILKALTSLRLFLGAFIKFRKAT